jgi:hypothetical protein
MSRAAVILILFSAATPEAGGDAIMRAGLHKCLISAKDMPVFACGPCFIRLPVHCQFTTVVLRGEELGKLKPQ